MTRLLVARLGVALEPYKIPARGNVRHCHYQASRATFFPVGTSPCRVLGATSFRSSLSAYFRGRSRRTRKLPFSTARSTVAPSSTWASAASDLGIRNPRLLLPHF